MSVESKSRLEFEAKITEFAKIHGLKISNEKLLDRYGEGDVNWYSQMWVDSAWIGWNLANNSEVKAHYSND